MKLIQVAVAGLMILFTIQSVALAQCGCGVQQPTLSGGYTWSAGEETAVIPFRLVRDHILVPVNLNGQGPFDMILDTGMPSDGAILFKSDKTDDLDLTFAGRAIVKGAPCSEGCGDSPAANVAFDVVLGLPGVDLTNQMVTVLDVGSSLGPDLHAAGVIGYGIFARFTVRIDYEKTIITLTEAGALDLEGHVEVIPFTPGPFDIPEVNLDVVMSGSERISVQVVVDTGAGHALSLHVDEGGAFELPENTLEVTIGRSMWGKVRGHIGRIDRLYLGKYSLDNVLTTFTSGEREGPAQCAKDGNLGNAALQRFHVTFDYAGRRMILEPNTRYESPFEYANRAGFEVSRDEGGWFTVEGVVPDSPAWDSGLRIGDSLLSIDGKPADQISRDDLTDLVGRKGETLRLEISRGEKHWEVSLTLRDLI